MNATEIMAGAALGVSGMALYFSLMAAWPQVKEWAESMRDLVLWIALVSVIGGLGYLGWQNYESQRQKTTSASESKAKVFDWQQ